MPIIAEKREFAKRPTDGWRVVRKIDLFADCGTWQDDYQSCEACGTERLRYVYILRHDKWPDVIAVGSLCKRRLTARWCVNAKGNYVLKVGRKRATVFQAPIGGWAIAFDQRFSRSWPTPQEAKAAAFDFMECR